MSWDSDDARMWYVQQDINRRHREIIAALEKRIRRLENHVQRLEDRDDIRSVADALSAD